jgi:hypothetical protein
LTFSIHVAGDFSPSQVEAKRVRSTLALPPKLKRSIESDWAKAIRKKGKLLFDGPLCRVESWQREPYGLKLRLSRTSYKWFWGTNLRRLKLPASQLANALGLSAVVQSSDDYLLLGRRNNKVAYHPNRVHPFAGSAVDVDVFAEMRRELAEELSFTQSDIAEIRCIGVAEDLIIRQPEVIFHVLSTRTRAEIVQRLDRAEHSTIWAVPAKKRAVSRAIENPGRLTPIAQAALLYWLLRPTADGLRRAIKKAERLLPGKPVEGSDPRWQAIMMIEDFIPSHPEPIWQFVLRWGKHPQADLRSAIGVLLLEHLLDQHFNLFFPRVRKAALANKRFKDTLSRCWWLGEAAWPRNADALDKLAGGKLARIRPRRPKKIDLRVSPR